ncbi:hypothetical protein CNR22_08620 [Sphingobacteriaceae bacterium]|nr:hypothetical protein CNR22_08620 [Sphingobacteriaceae bacterium]
MKYPLLFLFFAGTLAAQKKAAWDTTRYQKFSSNLMVGIFQSYRNFNNEFQQFTIPDSLGISKHKYVAESNLTTGIEVNYDKFSLGFAVKSTPKQNHNARGNTKTVSANFNFGGNRWMLENSIRYFKGFYDANTANYDTTFKETGNYYYQPDFTNTLFRSKFLYFTNHKRYSFRSAYVCNYRQLKSGATWIFSGNSTYNYLRNDSSFFPAATQAYYGDYGAMNGMKVFAVSLNAGGAASLVIWKAFFINFMFIVGPEQQWRTYNYTDGPSRNLSYFSLSGDVRGSIGLNFRRFYFMSFSRNDFAVYNSSFVGLTNSSIGGGFIMGWRFNSKTPEFYKKLQSTKLYSFF